MREAAPATYVALLRGINVGGKNVIPMAALVRTFEHAGAASVRTYIQSGNVVFASPERDVRALERHLERALSAAHRYDATVVVKSAAELTAIVAGVPRAWARLDPETRYNVLFLRHEIDSAAILDDVEPKRGVERVWYRPGVLFWSAHTSDLARTALAKLSARPIYQKLTVRNLATTRSVLALMTAAPAVTPHPPTRGRPRTRP